MWELLCECDNVCVCVCFRDTIVYACKKKRWIFLCVFLNVCVGATFVSMFGQFQGLMALPETQCESCVVRVSVRVCVFAGNHCVCL